MCNGQDGKPAGTTSVVKESTVKKGTISVGNRKDARSLGIGQTSV